MHKRDKESNSFVKTPDTKISCFILSFKNSLVQKFETARLHSDVNTMREINDLLINIETARVKFAFPKFSKRIKCEIG